MRTRRRWATVAMATIGPAALGVAACGDDGDSASAATTSEVMVVDFSFDPRTAEVGVGAEIAWTNADDFEHQVTVRDGGFASEPFGTGESVSTTFDHPGTYEYFCGIHNSMTGTITVT